MLHLPYFFKPKSSREKNANSIGKYSDQLKSNHPESNHFEFDHSGTGYSDSGRPGIKYPGPMHPKFRQKSLLSASFSLFLLFLLCFCILGGCTKNDAEEVEVLVESEIQESEETNVEIEVEAEPEIIEPTVISVTISAVGDVSLGPVQVHTYTRSFTEFYDLYGADYFLSGVRSIFEADDFTLVNLECVLTNETTRVDKKWNIKGLPSYTAILTGSSVEACSFANNHNRDYGDQSMTDTIEALEAAGLAYAYNQYTLTYTTAEGIVIGVVAANLLSDYTAGSNYLKNGIEELQNLGVDLIITCCHWGIERDYSANKDQIELAHNLIDWGADLVIGHHPHVLQGLEVYNGKVICYSLGNFCFGANKNPSDKETAIFQQTFTFVDGELQTDITAQMIPCTLSSVSGYNDFQPTVATETTKESIISNLNTYTGYVTKSVSLDADGWLIVNE